MASKDSTEKVKHPLKNDDSRTNDHQTPTTTPPISSESTVTTGQSAVTTHQNSPATRENAPATHENAAGTHENAPVTHENAPATHENAAGTHENAPATRENAAGTHENAPVTRANAAGTHESAPVTHENAPATYENAPATHESAAGTHESAATTHNTGLQPAEPPTYSQALQSGSTDVVTTTREQYTHVVVQVNFRLYIQHIHAEKAHIIIPDHKGKQLSLPLYHIEKIGNGDLWQLTLNFDVDPHQIYYRYHIFSKGTKSRVPLFWRILDTEDIDETEYGSRKINSSAQYDTFHFHGDTKYLYETQPRSSIFYAKWLLQFVYENSIKNLLMQIESMKFEFQASRLVKESVEEVLSLATNPSYDNVRRLYLSVVLGHLVKNNSYFAFPSDSSTKKNIDRLLRCFVSRSQLKLLPNSSLKILEEIAPHLVNGSSNPNWLTLAAHFYPYLGLKYVVKAKKTLEKCDYQEYQSLVNILLPVLAQDEMKGDDETQNLRRQLMYRVLQAAPNNEAVLSLYQRQELDYYFASKGDKENIFFEFYKCSFRPQSSKSINPGERLVELTKIPAELQQMMIPTINTTMLEYLKSPQEAKKEHLKAFKNLIRCLPQELVKDVLAALSKSRLTPLHGLLLKILNNKEFEATWREVIFSDKVNICFSWIAGKLRSPTTTYAGGNGCSKTTAAYEGASELMACSLINGNEKLIVAVCKQVTDDLLQYEEAISILKSLKRIENFPEIIQECYKNHVRQMLQNQPNLVRKVVDELGGYSSSSKPLDDFNGPLLTRLGRDLLLCILEVMKTPAHKDSSGEEDEFKEMLDWSDAWLIFLNARGPLVEKLRNIKKFKDGQKKWKALASCVKNGNVSLTFFSNIEKHWNNLSAICALVSIGENASRNEFSKEKTKFQICISELSQVQKDCEKKFPLLKSLINYAKTVSKDTFTIQGIPELVKEFNERQNCWKTRDLAELKDDSFWGPLLLLLRPAKAMQQLTKSVSFMIVAKMCLEEKQSELQVPLAEDEQPVTTDFQWLASFLTTEVIERFQSQWNPVFRDPGSLTMVTMKTLLGSLKSEEQLQEEFTFLEKYFRHYFPPKVKVYISDYVNFPSVLKRVKDMAALFDTFGVTNSTDSCFDILTSFVTKLEDVDDVSLKTLHESMLKVSKIVSGFAEDVESVVEELGRSKELVSFLKEIVDEDIRFLIDAVEEHSDQFVSESSVSDLIDVHGFLAPLIKNSEGSKAQTFLGTLKNSCTVHKKDMAVKLHQCSTYVNSLKGLYTSVANRGEITKEIVASTLKKGVYSVALQKDDGSINATMSYERGDTSWATFSLSELHDHRSRAHLIVNSDKNVQLSSDEKEINFADFIRQVNLFTEITTLLLKLRSSGYVKYRGFWRKMKTSNALQETKNKLQQDLETWDNILSSARGQYYLLNYYRSDQLCVLHDFLTNRLQSDSEDVLSLIHFVDPTITKEQLEVYRDANLVSKQGGSSENPHEIISIIGNALDEIFSNTKPVIRPIVDDQKDMSFSHSTFDATVKSGELFVATLESDSPLTANVMLTLYQNTSNAFPEPYQVLFCDPQTGWEEIHLILRRCFFQSKQLEHPSLFCIANVELLANEVQFKLVNVIKEMQNNVDGDGSLGVENADFRLALICRGGDHHHIVEQFSQYSHHIAGMSDLALSKRLKSRWPGVKMITSTLPGLGKTEKVKEEALEKKMNVVTFSISGPLDQSKLIQRLKKLNLKKYHCLHLDIGEVSDPLWLDTFLFQLIVTGMVSSETQLFYLLTTYVYIEIANTLKDWLRESLVLSKYFTRIHLQWENYEDLLVSEEITSDVQVVCQYFNAFDQGRLESEDIRFTGPQKVMSLPKIRCQELLGKYYSSEADITFTALNTFLGVLADQLLKFSKSAFFKIVNLKSMLGEEAHGVRRNLFRALLEVSKEFASRSITTCRSSQLLSLKESAEAFDKSLTTGGMSAEHMVKRVEGMIQWEDSNHLLVVFHGANSQAIAAVYRTKSLVPQNVEKLLKSQVVRGKTPELEDFKVMSQLQLQEKLEKIACAKLVKKSEEKLASSYALTPDNILKMILIILRVRAHAPVIIMGETGCGKTSLVRYLAKTCHIQFFTFNFHAGINEDEVIKFINDKQAEARETSQQIWVFLDEINTCDHLGLISDVMCHRSLLGRQLPQNLVFLAACNPYKLRPKEQIKTAGLQGKNITDEYSGLVYRVHPLPESMIDYVWDYGSLAPKDEKAYIQRMVSALPKKCENVLVSVLAESQKFIREAEKNHFCVSLRDVHRCILLIKWFQDMIIKRKKLKSANNPLPTHLKKYHTMHCKFSKTCQDFFSLF